MAGVIFWAVVSTSGLCRVFLREGFSSRFMSVYRGVSPEKETGYWKHFQKKICRKDRNVGMREAKTGIRK
jgi:hypothetical protein